MCKYLMQRRPAIIKCLSFILSLMALPLDTLVSLDMATSINHATTLSNDCVAYLNYIMSDITGVLLSFFAVFAYSYLALLRGVNFRTLLILLFALLVSHFSSEPMFASLVFITVSPDQDHKKLLLAKLEELRSCGIIPVIRRESMEINTLYDIIGFRAVDVIYEEESEFLVDDIHLAPNLTQEEYAQYSLPHGKLYFALVEAARERMKMANFNHDIEFSCGMTVSYCKQLFKCPELH